MDENMSPNRVLVQEEPVIQSERRIKWYFNRSCLIHVKDTTIDPLYPRTPGELAGHQDCTGLHPHAEPCLRSRQAARATTDDDEVEVVGLGKAVLGVVHVCCLLKLALLGNLKTSNGKA